MRAVTFDHPGDPGVLRVDEVADPPAPGPGEVLLDVAATAVNRADLLQRMGFYQPAARCVRASSGSSAADASRRSGAASNSQPGQPVCALLAGGGYAAKVLVPAGQVMPRARRGRAWSRRPRCPKSPAPSGRTCSPSRTDEIGASALCSATARRSWFTAARPASAPWRSSSSARCAPAAGSPSPPAAPSKLDTLPRTRC